MRYVGIAAVVAGVCVAGFLTRDYWLARLWPAEEAVAKAPAEPPIEAPKVLKLSPQARKNLKLQSKAVSLDSYWRTIQVPGVIADRPGVSDRGVISPADAIVTRVHVFAGDTVKPGDTLFTLQLVSEYLQTTQADLFKATREIQLLKEEHTRLEVLAQRGGIAGKRIIELAQAIRRQDALIDGHRHGLAARGLTAAQIKQVSQGEFIVKTIVVAPPAVGDTSTKPPLLPVAFEERPAKPGPVYEVQDLKVEIGEQVRAGQLLSVLSDHRSLYIEGHAFKQEAPMLELAAQNGWKVEVEFAEDESSHWKPLKQAFQIRHLANTIDRESRTFDFYIPLTNQSRTYQVEGRTFMVWRFRPGQRVRLHIPVEQFKNVISLPAPALVREGPEAYVFRQNGDLFNRIAVHVLHEDRRNVVVAQDGGVTPGVFLAQGSAASLNRVLKAQAASGMRADVHVHADGTVHASH